MYEDNVQPISQYQPSATLTAVNLSAPISPEYPTTPVLAATTPQVFSTESGAVKQLPSQTISAIANQQAIINNNASDAEKIAKGILPGVAGVTLTQVSAPGQVMKPGSGAFVQSLRQRAPGLPLDKLASPVTLNGNMGVNNINALTTNANVQLSAVSKSIQTATTQLTNNGVISNSSQPTQTSGIIMAATAFGASAVTAALKNPQAAISSLSSTANGIGNAITSGNFAASLADKVSSGVNGLSNSLGGFANSAFGAINTKLGSLTSGLGGLLSSGQTAMQNAFNVAEKSFGEMKAGVANFLGGGSNPLPTPSKTLTLSKDLSSAKSELDDAQAALVAARGAIDSSESQDAINQLRSAEAKVAAAEQKIEKLKATISNAATNVVPSAQSIDAAAKSALSGQLFAPTSLNTGANALPGGLGSLANVTAGAGANAVGAALSIVSATSSAIKNPADLAGNLVGNLQQKLLDNATSVTNKFADSLNTANKISELANSAANNATTALNDAIGSKIAGAKASVSSLLGNVEASLGSLGEGVIKSATLASNTYASTTAIVSATVDATLNPKVPKPVFVEKPVAKSPDVTLKQQVSTLQAIEELKAEREQQQIFISTTLMPDLEQDPTNVGNQQALANANKILANIDQQILAKQLEYDKSVT